MFRYSTFQEANIKGADQTVRMRRLVCTFGVRLQLSKKDVKDQETIQSSTTPDPGYHIGK